MQSSARASGSPPVTLITGASSLLTLQAGKRAKRGSELSDLGSIAGGEIAFSAGRIVAVGSSSEVRGRLRGRKVSEIDVDDRLVLPAFVDPHTHLVFAGQRAEEFEARVVGGADYLGLVASGHGSLDTVSETRAASFEDLEAAVLRRVSRMMLSGSGTIEIKTGYGMSEREELKHLEVIQAARAKTPVRLVPTALLAHFRPPEHMGSVAEYVDQLCSSTIPQIARRKLATSVDVFPHPGIYTIEECRRVLAAARTAGLAARVHADQFSNVGGVELAVEFGALSADHVSYLARPGIEALAKSSTVAVLIPGSSFFVSDEPTPPVREMVQEGVAIAIGTDFNPGTSPISSQFLAMGLAVVLYGLTAAEALAAATVNAAFAVGVQAHCGSLEAGKRADVLVLEASDIRDIPYRFGENLVWRLFLNGKPATGPTGVGCF